MKKAFTVVEAMIIAIVIGLLVAMAIPAFIKVKANVIEKTLQDGGKISNSDKRWYLEYKNHGKKDLDEKVVRLKKELEERIGDFQSVNVVPNNIETPKLQTVDIDGKRYALILKQKVLETTIDGKTYWLIPTP